VPGVRGRVQKENRLAGYLRKGAVPQAVEENQGVAMVRQEPREAESISPAIRHFVNYRTVVMDNAKIYDTLKMTKKE